VGNTAYILGKRSGKTAYILGTLSGEHCVHFRHKKQQKRRIF